MTASFQLIRARHSGFSVKPRGRSATADGLSGPQAIWFCRVARAMRFTRQVRRPSNNLLGRSQRKLVVAVSRSMPLRPVRPIPPWCRNFHATLRPQSRRSGNWDPRRKLQMSLLFWPQKMPAGSQDRSSASTAGSSEISRPLRRNAPLVFAYACRNSCPPDFCMVQYIGGEASIMSSEQFIQGIIGGLAIGCIYSLIALGITIIIRATEILHFAQGELMMIGAMAGL